MTTPLSKISIQILGEFRVCGPAGENLTPRPMGRALLALLVLAQRHSRPRAFLQDKLWSQQSSEESSTNLRRLLADIRKSLAQSRDILYSDRHVIGLDPSRILVDADDTNAVRALCERSSEIPVLLEDLDTICDPEFEDWLRDVRSDFESRFDTTAIALPPRALGLVADVQSQHNKHLWLMFDRSTSSLPSENLDEVDFLTEVLAGEIARGITETAVIDVVNTPNMGAGLIIKLRSLSRGGVTWVQVSLIASPSNILRWSLTSELSRGQQVLINTIECRAFINQITEVALSELHTLADSSPSALISGLGLEAIERIFSFQETELATAEQLLTTAFEAEPQPIFLALRAFLRTVYVGERLPGDRIVLQEEATALLSDAIQAAPHNGAILAMGSHVRGFMLGERAAGFELAERSLRYSPNNALAMAFLSRANVYAGRANESYDLAQSARAIAGGPPSQRVLIEFNSCVAALAKGAFPEATRLAEIAHSVHPTFRPPIRYLFALNLHHGNRQKARVFFNKMRTFEPDFGLRLMNEPSYPNQGLLAAGILPIRDPEFD